MNVPAIRAALERLQASAPVYQGDIMEPLHSAVVRVGQRACDEWEKSDCRCQQWSTDPKCCSCEAMDTRLEVIADILRESGVEVGE